MIDYLDLVDYLLIAEAVTGIPAETLAKLPRMDGFARADRTDASTGCRDRGSLELLTAEVMG